MVNPDKPQALLWTVLLWTVFWHSGLLSITYNKKQDIFELVCFNRYLFKMSIRAVMKSFYCHPCCCILNMLPIHCQRNFKTIQYYSFYFHTIYEYFYISLSFYTMTWCTSLCTYSLHLTEYGSYDHELESTLIKLLPRRRKHQKYSIKTNYFVRPEYYEGFLTNPCLSSPWDRDRIMSPDIEAAHTLVREQKASLPPNIHS